MTNIESSDALIIVMGRTGCGKSTFINSAAGKTAPGMNYNMESSSSIEYTVCSHPTSQKLFTLVETPGFDNSDHENLSDPAIAEQILTWLKDHSDDDKLVGFLYLRTQRQAEPPALPGWLNDDIIKQRLHHVVTIHKPESGGSSAAEHEGDIFQKTGEAGMQDASAWAIIDKVFRKLERRDPPVEPSKTGKDRKVAGGGFWEWLLSLFSRWGY